MESADVLTGRTVLITGGTGSFGGEMVRHLLRRDVEEVRVFSRDESKQDAMRHAQRDSRLRFYIGDVRDLASVERATKSVDLAFHAAALKQVPSCEFFPIEAVRTNVMGSANVVEACERSGVSSLVCLSTDKAVYPVNAMGQTKALMEKVAQAHTRNNPTARTTVSSVRYGNVMYSRGSVIPLFVEQMRSGRALTITSPRMTRFMMTLAESVALVEHAFTHAQPGDLFVRKTPACTIDTLVKALGSVFGHQLDREIIGVRHGEKMHETLASAEELSRAEDHGEYYRVPIDSRDLNYSLYFDVGEDSTSVGDYDSSNAEQLDTEQTAELLRRLPEIQAELGGGRTGAKS